MAETDPSPASLTEEDVLLAKLEEQNRLLQQDSKVAVMSPRNEACSLTESIGSNTSAPFSSLSAGGGGNGVEGGHAVLQQRTSVLGLVSAILRSDGQDRGSTSGAGTKETGTPEPVDEYKVWGEVLANWDDTTKRKPKQLQKLVRGGIPTKVRGLAWQMLSGSKNLTLSCGYVDLLERDSACEKQIRRDLARTFPDHDFFKEKDSLGQEALFNVMKAYSLHDREVGYCQGSPFIVGLLLMQMPEEDAFGVLVKLMQDYRLRELFKPSMSELGICLHQLDSLIQEHLHELYGHFQAQGFHSTMYASSWFLTIFSSTLPLDMVFRVMDCFLLDGMEMVFRISVALLHGSYEELLNMDMESMVKHLQYSVKTRYEDKAECEQLFAHAFDLKINSKKLKKIGRDYQAQRERETEESVENRRLRNENQILTHRITLLEEETQTLAQRLIEGQVTRAEEAEEVFALRREMAALRKQLHDLSSRPTTPSAATDGNLERMRSRVSQLEDDSHELTQLRRREAEMAGALASSQARIAELASQTVELCRLQRQEAEYAAQVSVLNEDATLLRQQIAEKTRLLKIADLSSSSVGGGSSNSTSTPLSPGQESSRERILKMHLNGVVEADKEC